MIRSKKGITDHGITARRRRDDINASFFPQVPYGTGTDTFLKHTNHTETKWDVSHHRHAFWFCCRCIVNMSSDSSTKVTTKPNRISTACTKVPKMMAIALTLCLQVPLFISLNGRSSATMSSENEPKRAFHPTLASRLLDPLFTTSSDTNVQQQPYNGGDRIILDLNDTFFFWHNSHSKFCNVIRQITNVTELGVDQPYHIRRQQRRQHSLPTPLLRAKFDCVAITTDSDIGTGNWITAIYAMRIPAALGMVDLEIQCKDGLKQDYNHLLSWFTGYFHAPTTFQSWPYDPPVPQDATTCQNRYSHLLLDSMVHEIQSDLRKLAVTVLGNRKEFGWSHPLVPRNQPPLVSNVTLDDVVIHFRCGDVFGGVKRTDYGIIHFSEYKKWISNSSTTSLGIVTQPFSHGKFTRAADIAKGDECRQVVTALVDYLQGFLPNTTIRIHNDPNEPLAVTYARMVMSKQVFVSYSSFGIFPVIGTFGDGYFQSGKGNVNPWANHVPQALSNVHMMNAPHISSRRIMRTGFGAALTWLLSPIKESSRQNVANQTISPFRLH
jgi:hypothetical protein